MLPTTTLSPQIPYDVLIQICEQLGNDKKTLKSLSTTASFYRSPAQRSLFRRIDIGSSRYLRGFERTVKSKSTSIGSFVRELVLVGLKPGDPWLEDFVTLGNVLDQVRTVELSIADMLTIMPKLGDWVSQHVVGHFPRLGTMKITTPNLLPTSQICDLLSAFPQLKHLHVSAGLLSDDSYPAFTSKFTHNLKSLSLKGYNAKESKDDPLHQLEWIMKHSKNHGLQNVTFDLFDVDMRLCSKVANICVVNPQKTRIILDARSSTAPIFQTGGVSRCNRTIRLCLLDRHCILDLARMTCFGL
ncbi:unnamed protein product [Somion occarium]|uniref:F-box domain-containing protein n=1 Tax=Somion occarium TaxID=3059160 RepID=A0ABP1D575_9APHY